MGSTPALAVTYGPFASPSLAVTCDAFDVILRHSVRAVSGELLSSSGLEEVL